MSGDQEVRSVRVQIFGEDHIIKGQASEEYIRDLASLVDSRLQEVQKLNPRLPRHRVAILVAINLANELEKLSAGIKSCWPYWRKQIRWGFDMIGKWIDLVILVFLALSLLKGFKRGLVRELFSLLGAILAIIIAYHSYQTVALRLLEHYALSTWQAQAHRL